MVFDGIKASFTSKRRRRASTALSDIPFVRYEETPEVILSPPLINNPSWKSFILPSITLSKPLTVNKINNIGKQSTANMEIVAENAEAASPLDASQANKAEISTLHSTQPKLVIKRKPVGQVVTDPRSSSYVPPFDPQAPRKDASLHARAREVLKKRYQSKFFFDFLPCEGANIRDYDFLWVKPGELEQRVLGDIIWVRERYAFARKDEPTDEDIIFFYDADAFDEEIQDKEPSGENGDDVEDSRENWSVSVQIEGNRDGDD